MTCIRYMRFSIKWSHRTIQFCSENMIFFMFKYSDTTLVKSSLTHCATEIRALSYLLRKHFNFLKIFFVLFMHFLGTLPFWFRIFLRLFSYSFFGSVFSSDLFFFIFLFWLRIFLIFSFLHILFLVQDFLHTCFLQIFSLGSEFFSIFFYLISFFVR